MVMILVAAVLPNTMLQASSGWVNLGCPFSMLLNSSVLYLNFRSCCFKDCNCCSFNNKGFKTTHKITGISNAEMRLAHSIFEGIMKCGLKAVTNGINSSHNNTCTEQHKTHHCFATRDW